jgi:hypothetical protein
MPIGSHLFLAAWLAMTTGGGAAAATPSAPSPADTPCRGDAKYDELDFWLGEWDVVPAGAPPGTPAARSVITKILENCVVLESWYAPGSTGQSFNLYDRSKGQWHQAWVDVRGNLHAYWGRREGRNMVYRGDLPPRPGTSRRRDTRLTFFDVDARTVRQLSEDTPDGGRTWTKNFDLIYRRRAAATGSEGPVRPERRPRP